MKSSLWKNALDSKGKGKVRVGDRWSIESEKDLGPSRLSDMIREYWRTAFISVALNSWVSSFLLN